jgi:uncharacterized protein (DUF433 family)
MDNMIVTDPKVLGGKPVIRGTRISVGFILKLVSSGWSMGKILENYPHLTREGINAAIERVFPVVEQTDHEAPGR